MKLDSAAHIAKSIGLYTLEGEFCLNSTVQSYAYTQRFRGSLPAGLEQAEAPSREGSTSRPQEAACFTIVGKCDSVPMWATKGEHTVSSVDSYSLLERVVLGYEPDNLLTFLSVIL